MKKMSIPNNGAFSQRFTQGSPSFSGNKTRSPQPPNNMTVARADAMNQIYALAKQKGITVDQAVTRILTNSSQNLVAYIQSKGEIPVSDPVGMALQAALLRMSDVATTAAILDTTDEDALQTIEGAEQDALVNNSPDASTILPIPVQGALACVMQHASEESSGKTMGQIVQGISDYGKYVKSGGTANNDDGVVDVSDPSSITDWTNASDIIDSSTTTSDPSQVNAADNSLSATSINTALASIPGAAGPNPISVAAGIPTIANSASNLPQAGPNTSSGGVLNSITSIFSGITSAANSLSTAARSTTGAVGSVKGALSGIGASSISQWITNNSMVIILMIVVIVVAIIAVNAGKRK